VNNIDISYALRGNGNPLVMIMGFSGNAEWWPPELIKALARHYKLLLFDNRGTGRTSDNGSLLSISLMVKDTIGLMDSLGIERAHIFGVSMGGLIAQEIALNYPDRVRQLALGCTCCGPLWGVKFSLNNFNLWIDYLTRADVRSRNLFTNLFFSKSFLTRHPDKLISFRERAQKYPTCLEIQLKQIGAMLCFDSYWRLRQIQAPSLVMTGTEDCMVPPLNSDILAELIPHTRLTKLNGCGHGFIIEAAEAVSRELMNFLES
jgi:pimeloyl-ACP methyl ester carboxylesterase